MTADRLGRGIAFFACAAALGCSTSSSSGDDDAGSDADAQAEVDSGLADADAGSQTCAELQQEAAAPVQSAYAAAYAGRSCTVDDDCVIHQEMWTCSLGCPAPLNTSGLSAVTSAEDDASRSPACLQFVAQGCVASGPPCYAQGTVPQCVANLCAAGR